LNQPANYTPAFSHKHGFNGITRYLHSFRFGKVLEYMERLQREIPDRPIVIVDIGCGSGGFYEVLKDRFNVRFIGVEILESYVLKTREKYKDDPRVTILNRDAAEPGLYEDIAPDIVVALESMEHIPHDKVAEIIRRLKDIPSLRLFIASVPVEIGPSLWIKNFGSLLMGYHRHREYTWTQTFWAGLYKLDKLPRHAGKHMGFDWRWLSQTIRLNLKMLRTHTSPFDLIPAWLSPSILFVAKPDHAKELGQ
jgi:SAM-dependent methyltransferase